MARTELTRKEQILRMIQKLPDDVTYDRVIYHLDVMKSIEIGLEQIERGEVIDHDELVQKWKDEGWLDEGEPASSGPGRPPKKSKKPLPTSPAATAPTRPGHSAAKSSRRSTA